MRMLFAGLISATLLLSTGCAYNGMQGDGGTVAAEFYGDSGIMGNGNNMLIKRGSKVDKLSIIGANNLVTIEEGAWVRKLEIAGNNNTIYIPRSLAFQKSTVGRNFLRYLDEVPNGTPTTENPAGAAPASSTTHETGTDPKPAGDSEELVP